MVKTNSASSRNASFKIERASLEKSAPKTTFDLKPKGKVVPKAQAQESIFRGVEAFLTKTYREDLAREKPINFTSRNFKRYLKENSTVTKLSLLRLRKMVADSDAQVENVRRG